MFCYTGNLAGRKPNFFKADSVFFLVINVLCTLWCKKKNGSGNFENSLLQSFFWAWMLSIVTMKKDDFKEEEWETLVLYRERLTGGQKVCTRQDRNR